MLAQAHGGRESFSFFEKVFAPVASELKLLDRDDISIGEQRVTVHVLYDCHYKVLDHLTVMKGAQSKFPCPFFMADSSMMDWTYAQISKIEVSNVCRFQIISRTYKDLRINKVERLTYLELEQTVQMENCPT